MEVLVGTALMLIVFAGIFGLIRMGFKMIGQSKARVTAAAIANEKIELVRNLAYDSVGTIGGVPNGSIPETENITRNGVDYTTKTTVIYIDDPFDGVFPADPLALDYKRVKVEVSWSGFLAGSAVLQTDVAPKGIETVGGGGIISILVFDVDGKTVPQADIHIENSSSTPPIDAIYQSDNQGRLFLPGAPACDSCYKITVTKSGWSEDRTYFTGELVRGVAIEAPAKPPLLVIENKLSEISFSIGRLATKTVQTIKYVEEKIWSDSFENETKISEKNQVVASTTLEAIILEEANGQYLSSGYLLSAAIVPTGLTEWGRLNWGDDRPISTDIKFQLLYSTSSDWLLIPDQDMAASGVINSEGFSAAPVDLSGLNPIKYGSLKIKANFSTTNPLVTPTLFDWEVTWFSSDTATPIGNLAFSMQGAKILGTDSSGQPIYKYKENLSTDASGRITISDLEWDSYRILINGLATGYNLANSLPRQPLNLNPGANQTTVLKLANRQANTLLVTVEDAGGLPLVGANVRLYKSGYDKTRLSSDSGQVFFSPLSISAYTIEATMVGYQDFSDVIDVSGQSEKIIVMTLP